MRSILLGLALLASAWTGAARAQDQQMTVQRLADGVYGMVQSEARYTPVECNVLVVIGPSDVLVFDANRTPAGARAVIAEIRRLTDRPVRFVINSHWHDDHVLGNQAYLEAYPGVQIIAHRNTREDGIAHVPNNIRNSMESYRTGIPRIEEALRTGIKSDGTRMTDEERRRFTHRLGVYRTFMENLRPARYVPPTLAIDGSLTLYQGEREIQLRYFGNGNTRGDLALYLPRERILATGDLLVHPVPYAFGPYHVDWVGTMTAMRQLDAGIIIPGHGPVMRDHAFFDDVTALLGEITRHVRDGVARGLSLEDVQRTIRLDTFRDRMAGTDSERLGTWEASIINTAIPSAYQQAGGVLPPPAPTGN